MSSFSQTKASQLIGTGALMVIFSSGIFALLYVIHGEEYYDDGEKIEWFDRNSAFWTSTPVVIVGLLGVLAGITKKHLWVCLYMIGSAVTTVLSVLVAIVIGIRVSNIRVACGEDSECRNSDKAVLMGTIVLLASILVTIAIWACVKACQSKWGPAKKPSSLHVVGEFRTANRPTPPPTVVIHRESQPLPLGNGIAVSAPSGQDSNTSPQSSACESVENVEPHKYDDVTLKPTNKINDSPQYENNTRRGNGTEGSDTGYETVSQDTDLRGEGTGDDDAGYETMAPVIKDYRYENVRAGNNTAGDLPDKTSMKMPTGNDSSKVVEVHRDPVQEDRHGNKWQRDNQAFESDELTTAL